MPVSQVTTSGMRAWKKREKGVPRPPCVDLQESYFSRLIFHLIVE
jgi:hypothetical protein